MRKPAEVTPGTAGIGYIGYSGMQQTTDAGPNGEDVVASGVQCSIQAASTGRNARQGGTPSDAPGPVHWKIFMPKTALAKGQVRDRDIVIDDEGYRYHVEAAYWAPLGYQLKAIRLEI